MAHGGQHILKNIFRRVTGKPRLHQNTAEDGPQGRTRRFFSPEKNRAIRESNSSFIRVREQDIAKKEELAQNNPPLSPSADIVPPAPETPAPPEFAPPTFEGAPPTQEQPGGFGGAPLDQVSPFGQQDFFAMLMQALQGGGFGQQQPPPTEFIPNEPDPSQLGAISGGNFGSGVPVGGIDPALLMTIFGAGQGQQRGFI